MALVGGYHRTRREVINELSLTYNLKDCREIPPSSEQYFKGHSVREAISHCHLIAAITRYVGHDLTELVSDLHQSGALRGEVLMVNCRGKSGIVREILNHVTSQTA